MIKTDKMSDGEGLWAAIQAEWIKVCPCRLIRKNICMFFIVVRCVESMWR